MRLRRMQRQGKAQDTADRLMRRMEGAGQPLKTAWCFTCGGKPFCRLLPCCYLCHVLLLPTPEAAHAAAACAKLCCHPIAANGAPAPS